MEIVVRNARLKDLDACFTVELAGFSLEEAATIETIQLRINTFPQGFFVAEVEGKVVGMVNGACTNKEDISDEELKKLIGHESDGRNMVIFGLAVLPEFQRRGIASQLILRFIEEARQNKKEKILLICKHSLISYYEKLGFVHEGLSRSTHGGAEWHEMRLSLQ